MADMESADEDAHIVDQTPKRLSKKFGEDGGRFRASAEVLTH